MRICIIGGGIVGLNIAYTLATSKMLKNSEIYLFETEPYLGHHASSRNSEVIHAGLSYPEGSLKARLCIEGKYLTYDLLKRLNVPVNRSGKWIIAINEDELEALEKMAANAHRCGATEVSMSKPREALAAEPSLQNITGAAYSPTSGIMDTAAYIKALEVALSNLNNVNLIFPCKIDWLGNDQLLSERGEMEYDIAINAAGLFADDIYRSAGGTKKYQIIPYKGEYYTWRSGRINSLIYPVPQKFLKANQNDPTKMGNFGIHLHRSLAGDQLLGPSLIEMTPDRKLDYSIENGPDYFADAVSGYLKNVKTEDLQPFQAGNRAKLFLGNKPIPDFQIFREGDIIHLLGIESPGLTSAPAIAKYVHNLI